MPVLALGVIDLWTRHKGGKEIEEAGMGKFSKNVAAIFNSIDKLYWARWSHGAGEKSIRRPGETRAEVGDECFFSAQF